MQISKKENHRKNKRILRDLQMVVDDLERKNDNSLDGRLALSDAREHLYVAKDWCVQDKTFKAKRCRSLGQISRGQRMESRSQVRGSKDAESH